MQNISRFFLRDTATQPIANLISSNAEGYYIEDTYSNLFVSKQDLIEKYGISDERLLNLFGDDGTIFEKKEDAVTVIEFLKDNI